MMADSTRATKWIIASGAVGLFVAVVWLGAPLIPAVLGAVGAGLLLYYRAKK